MWCFDCEVFQEDWMFVFIDTEDNTKRKIIINNEDELISFYNEYKNEIFIGYNARSYDQFIIKAVLTGEDPKKVNDYIIIQNNKGGTFSKKFKNIELLIYDCMIDKLKSLKQLEAFMGNDIRETSVDFNLTRKLTQDEIELTKKYCVHDVEQTIEVYKRQPEEFESQTSLVKAFNLPENYMNKTKAQLSAIILGAKNNGNRFDEFDIIFHDTLIISDKYKYIVNWYKQNINRNYELSLKTKVMNVPHVFAWGGIHGAIPNYSGEGYYIMSDVASLYPSIMLEYNFLSRNVPNPAIYRQIRDTRIELKHAKNPMQLPYKIVLNSTYGAMKDKYNQLYDPLMANNVCVAGQLLLLDLIDKIEIAFGDSCELIQSNTDGILVKFPNESYYDKYVTICNEWCKRTRLDLEHDVYVKVYQKDVNNYVIVPEGELYDYKGKPRWKAKGSYVKKLNDLDNDLPIVNKALINKLVHDTSIEDTVTNCDELMQFQKVVKITRAYDYGMNGDNVLGERVLRVFASTLDADGGIFKFRDDKAGKVGNTPDKAFIYNDDVHGVKATERLDKQWYIDLAYKRYTDFMARSETEDESIDIYELIDDSYTDFTEVIKDVKLKSHSKQKDFENLILMNYFERFGSVKKLVRQNELFKIFYEKTNVDKEKLIKFKIDVEHVARFGHETMKKINKLDGTAVYYNLVSLLINDDYGIKEIIEMQQTKLKRVTYINPSIDKNVAIAYDVDAAKGKFKLYCINNGKSNQFIVDKNLMRKIPLAENDIIKLGGVKKDYESLYMGIDNYGKPIYEKNCAFPIWRVSAYTKYEEVNQC